MLFPIIIFLMTLSPLYIPVAMTLVGVYSNWRGKRRGRPVGARRPRVASLPTPA
jgi:hypothetical protein